MNFKKKLKIFITMPNQTQNLDIVSLIQENPIINLNKIYQNKLINKIKNKFSTSEQQIFVLSHYGYLHYTKDDYPVNLDDIWESMGFSEKGKAKRTLAKNFAEPEDYKILQICEEKETRGGSGLNKEKILMKVDTFKAFCLIAKTKKGKEIRNYFLKLEEILHETLNEESNELRIQLHEQTELTRSTQIALDVQKETFMLHLNKRFYGSLPCETVYAYKDNMNDVNSLITLGRTKNIMRRESSYNTHNKSGQMIYAKTCYDEDLTEKVIHHILDKYRLHKNQEWFTINEDLSKEVINISQLILDEFIPYTDLFVKYNVYNKIKNILDEIKNNENTKNVTMLTKNNYESKYDKINKNVKEIKKNEEQRVNDLVENLDIKANNPLDFTKFINEYCQIGEEKKCIKMELYGAHRIWSRNAENNTRKAIYKYMDEKYKSKTVFFEEYQSNISCFIGIELKKSVFKPENELPTDYEQFIIDRCKVGYTYRTNYESIYNEFINWKKESLLDYNLNNTEKNNLRHYLNKKFFPSSVYLKVAGDKREKKDNTNSQGVWGLTLKTDNTNIGLNITPNQQKKVIQINIETKEIVNRWDSATSASKTLKVNPSVISTDIRFERVRNNCVLKYIDKENKGQKIEPIKYSNGKPIIKIDIKNKKVIKKWETVTEALKEIKCAYSTLIKYIDSEKNIDGYTYKWDKTT
jgi:phage anti-repressor protein